jgi:hypothetical protein
MELGFVGGVEGEVVDPSSPSDEILRESGLVTGHIEGEDHHRIAVAVGEGPEATKRQVTPMFHENEADAEHVFVEAAEPVEIGRDDGGVPESAHGLCRCGSCGLVWHGGFLFGSARRLECIFRVPGGWRHR